MSEILTLVALLALIGYEEKDKSNNNVDLVHNKGGESWN